MKRKEFIKLIPPESTKFRLVEEKKLIILKCRCKGNDCLGWAFVWNDKESIKLHKKLYQNNR